MGHSWLPSSLASRTAVHAHPTTMVQVFFSVDVEIWCDNWQDIDAKFGAAFQQYIYGTTRSGDFGLPYQLQLLSDHGLKAVFFVEPLFASRFGVEPLREIVELIHEGGQEVQLHLHTEWVDESRTPLLPGITTKRQFLRQFDLNEQTALVETGLEMLRRAGVDEIKAFRAGSFGFNADTLTALEANGIPFDSSYNPLLFGMDSGIANDRMLLDSTPVGAVHELPMTIFRDGTRRLRHAQLGACSYSELRSALEAAHRDGRETFMILSHSFELLAPAKRGPDRIVVDRMRKLCKYLDQNRERFCTQGFVDYKPNLTSRSHSMLEVPLWTTLQRLVEQAVRRGLN